MSIELSELRAFFAHPVKSFFTNRLNVAVPRVHEESDAQLPTSLGPLDISAVGSDLLAVGLRTASSDEVMVDRDTGRTGTQAQAVIDEFRARGLLPPPVVSHAQLVEISQEVAAMLTMAERYGVRRRAPIAHQVDLALPGGIRLIGSVDGCIDGDRPGPVHIAFHRSRPRHEIWLALDLLVLTAAHPEITWRGVSVARPNRGQVEPVTMVKEVQGSNRQERRANAVDALDVLVEQFRDGQCYPLPLFEKTSYHHHGGGKPKNAWDPRPKTAKSPGEGEDGYHVMAFGSLAYDELIGIEPGGYSLDGEAARLWGTLASAVVELHGDDEEEAGP